MIRDLGIRYIFIAVIVLTILPSIYIISENKSQLGTKLLKTPYGTYDIDEPIIIELLEHPALERLKYIHQYGIDYYTFKQEEYNRYDHSVGVFVLLRKYDAPLKEQIAGLLHDVSHTAFSHLADFRYKKGDLNNSYQDDIHEQFLENSGLCNVLNKYGFSVTDIIHKNKEFIRLEQELPNVCADRLEYNLRGGLIEGSLTQEDVISILNTVQFEQDKWFFTDSFWAKKLAYVSLYLTEHRWSSPDGMLRNIWGSQILDRAADVGIINTHDFHYGNDDILWKRLINSCDDLVKITINKMYSPEKFFSINDRCYDTILKGKFRGIDPWIKMPTGFSRLSEIDEGFFKEYQRVKSTISKGWYIKFTN